MSSWAYEFFCEKSLYEMERILAQTGIWYWHVKDCAWYQDYLICRPFEKVRICIYQTDPPEGRIYRTFAEILPGSELERATIENNLLKILDTLPAKDCKKIDVLKWPF